MIRIAILPETTMKAFLALALLVVSGLARAAGCSGALVEYAPLAEYNGQRIGAIELYYDAATGNNCARLMHGGWLWGVSAYTSLYLHICDANGRNCRSIHDNGDYRYYAGPLTAYGRNRCVSASGAIAIPGTSTSRAAVTRNHCD